jgi:hypothetical protein
LGESKLASNTGKGFGKGSFSGKFSGDSELVQSFKKLGPPPDKKNGGYYGKPSWKDAPEDGQSGLGKPFVCLPDVDAAGRKSYFGTRISAQSEPP